MLGGISTPVLEERIKKNKIKKKKKSPNLNGEDAPGVENEQNEILDTSESIITLFMPL